MKRLISDEVIDVERKGQDFRKCRTPDLILMLSNRHTPLVLEGTDRRAFVPEFVQKPLEPTFYGELNQCLTVELPGFLEHLLRRDVTSFSPDAPPPHTAAKAEVIGSSMPALAADVSSMIEAHQPPFDQDLVLPEGVANTLRERGHRDVTPSAVSRVLKELGGLSCGQLPPPPKHRPAAWRGQPRVWAVRNLERWRDATRAELSAHLLNEEPRHIEAAA